MSARSRANWPRNGSGPTSSSPGRWTWTRPSSSWTRIESRTQSSTLFALHLYDLARQNKLTPEIRSLLAPQTGESSAPGTRPLFRIRRVAAGSPISRSRIPPAEMDKEIREILALDSYQKLVGDYAGTVIEEQSRGGGNGRGWSWPRRSA